MRFSLDRLLATAAGILKLVSSFAGLIVSQVWWKKTAVPELGKLGKRSHKLEATMSDIRWKSQLPHTDVQNESLVQSSSPSSATDTQS